MAALVMPLLVLNMASEMVFILDAQLRDKKAPRVRRRRVLCDMLRALHGAAFVDALFTPVRATPRAVRGLLGRLANAPAALSVNARAMDALYETVRLGVQRQLMVADSMLLGVTLHHVESTRRLVELTGDRDDDDDDMSVGPLLDETIVRVFETYRALSSGKWLILRQRLLGLVQSSSSDKATPHVFMADQDGDEETQEEKEAVGLSSSSQPPRRSISVRYFGGEREESEHETLDAFAKCRPSRPTGRCRSRYSTLSSRCASEPTDEADAPTVESIVGDAKRRRSGSGSFDHKQVVRTAPRTFNGTASDALGLLAELLGSSAEAKSSGWKLSLQNEDEDDWERNATANAVEKIVINARSERKEIDALRYEWEMETKESAKRGGVRDDDDEEEEDLLRFMDSTL